MLRILVIDDEEMVIKNWKRVSTAEGWDLKYAKSLSTAREYFAPGSRSVFDVIIVDLHLEDGLGIDLLPLITSRNPKAGVAVVSCYVDSEVAFEMQACGVMVVPKPVANDVLKRLVLKLAADGSRFELAVDSFCQIMGLSDRETAVLRLAVLGKRNVEIAKTIGCGPRTIDTYWRRIFKKTGQYSQRDVIAAVARSNK